jgi:DNA-binding transcriptional LysR family regulator
MQDTKQPGVPGTGSEDRSSGHNLRHLDFDDLFLLSHLLSGKTIAATARQLGLTQPAVTQRVRKIERVFEEQILQKVGRHVRLTREGLAICHRAGEALKLMRDVSAFNQKGTISVGASHDLSRVWILPMIAQGGELADSIQIQCGSTAELARMLETGEIQALLTEAEILVSGTRRIVIGEDELLLVARPEFADRLTSVEALANVPFCETDRSMPNLNLVPAKTKLGMVVSSVRYLGNYGNIINYLVGHDAVAIMPVSVVKGALEAGTLKALDLDLDLAGMQVALYVREDRLEKEDADRMAALFSK